MRPSPRAYAAPLAANGISSNRQTRDNNEAAKGIIISSVFNAVWTIFNFSSELSTRFVLLLLTILMYQMFVLVEIFINSFHLLYPPILKDALSKVCGIFSLSTRTIVKAFISKAYKMSYFIRHLLYYLIWMFRFIISPYVFIKSLGRSEKCAPPSNPLLLHSATKLAAMIRHKQVKSEEVMKAYIERCREVNTVLNAVVEPRYEVALAEAKNVDKFLALGTKTTEELERELPLLGLPITIKESIAVEGMSNDAGLVYEKRTPAKQDADCVRLAREAGAIPLAVTNTPELCMNWETFNNVTGLTRNPYNSKRTCGGSSGGECALISSGASIMGIGSDIAGSLRLPVMFTGVYGHKPSPHVISTKGHMPYSTDPEWDDYFALGPITRYAEDLPLLLNAIRSQNGPQLQLNKPVNLRDLKFYYINNNSSGLTDNLGRDMKNALKNMETLIKDNFNIDVEKVKIKNWEKIFEVSVKILVSLNGVFSIYNKPENLGEWKSIWPEVIKKIFGCSNRSFNAMLYGPLKKVNDMLPKSHIAKMKKCKEEIKNDLLKILGENGVLIHPVFPSPAHWHYEIFYKFLNIEYLLSFTLLGLPVTTIPLGFAKSGLPVGVQLVAAPGNDHLTMAVAKEMEMFTGGWKPPNSARLLI